MQIYTQSETCEGSPMQVYTKWRSRSGPIRFDGWMNGWWFHCGNSHKDARSGPIRWMDGWTKQGEDARSGPIRSDPMDGWMDGSPMQVYTKWRCPIRSDPMDGWIANASSKGLQFNTQISTVEMNTKMPDPVRSDGWTDGQTKIKKANASLQNKK